MRPAVEIADRVRKGELKAETTVREALDKIEARNPALNAFVALDADAAFAAAKEVDAKVARGEDPGLLAGVPFGVKDLEDAAGFRTTQGSWFHKDSPIKTVDTPYVAKLKAAGAIVVGKTATAEWGMDSATNTALFGPTRNPWNPATTPGGSSGGSSSAVAAGMVPFATATDGGGSIREPAAFTNLIGLKPSHGRIAKTNGFSNFSVHGTVTRTVADTARFLDVTAGPDDSDRQSLPHPGYAYEDIIETLDVRNLSFVWSPDHGYAVVEPEVMELARQATDKLMRAAGLVEVAYDFRPTNIKSHWVDVMIGTLEQDLTRDGYLPGGYDKLSRQTRDIIDRLRARTTPLNIPAAWAGIKNLEQEVASLFRSTDLLISPATACRPYGADSTIPQIIDGRDAKNSNVEPFGMLANACWNPSISIPAGFTSDGLPVGLQITARRHRDDILLRLARIYEQAAPWTYPWD